MLATLKFEASLTRLEELVRTLEQGDLSLEESLRVFEEGVRLSKNCAKMLNDAEKKVEILISQKDVGTPLKEIRTVTSTDLSKTEDVTIETIPE